MLRFFPIWYGIIKAMKTKGMTMVGHSPKHPIYLARNKHFIHIFNSPAIIAVIIHLYCQQSPLLPAIISAASSSSHLCIATTASSSNY